MRSGNHIREPGPVFARYFPLSNGDIILILSYLVCVFIYSIFNLVYDRLNSIKCRVISILHLSVHFSKFSRYILKTIDSSTIHR